MPTLYEYQDVYYANVGGYGSVTLTTLYGQTFSPQVNHILTSITLMMDKYGSPTGAVTVGIRKDSPTGEPIYAGFVACADLPAQGSPAEVSFPMNVGGTVLLADSTYFMEISSQSTGVDVPRIYHSTPVAPGLYTRGAGYLTTDAGVTWNAQIWDLYFKEYGTSATVTYPSDDLSRVTSLIHRYSEGNYTLELILGDVTASFDSPIISPKPMPSLPPTPLPVPAPVTPTPPPVGDTSITCPVCGERFASHFLYAVHYVFMHPWGYL